MKSRILGTACAILVLLCAGFPNGDGSVLWAQQSKAQDLDAEPAAASGTEEEAPPVAIPSTEIASRATSTISVLTEMSKTAVSQPQVEEISAALPELIATIEQLRDDPVNAALEDQAPFLLEDARLQWVRLDTRLAGWGHTLDTRAQTLYDARAQVHRFQETWTLTRTETAGEELPTAVTQQIQTVLETVDATDRELQIRQDVVLTLQNQISEQVIAIGVQTGLIDSALDAVRNDVLRRDLPPIWRAGSVPIPAVRGQLQETWDRLYRGGEQFVTNYRDDILKQFAFFLVLSLLVFVLNRKAKRYQDQDESIQAASSVLKHPLVAAGLLTVLVSDLFYPNAPLVIKNLLPVLALPLAARLAAGLVPRSLLRPLYSLLVLSFVSNLQNLFLDQGPVRRSILLVIAMAAIAGLIWLQRRTRTKSLLAWPRVSTVVVHLGGLTFSISVVANFLGFVALAELITYATLESAFLAFVLLAAVRIAEALVMVGLRTGSVRSLASIRFHTVALQHWISRFVRLGAVILWLSAVLKLFQVRQPVLGLLEEWLTRSWQVGSVHVTPTNVILFAVVLWVARLLAKIVRGLLEDDILPRAHVERGVGTTISTLINYTILALGILLALAAAGFDVQQFALVAGALGVGIGFGLQNVVNNFVSGLILIFERPVQKGDKVQVGTLVGEVKHIGIRASTVRTFDGADVIVPNADFISSQVINFTLSDRLRRITVEVGVAYGTDPVSVPELLVNVAGEHEKVLENPVPYVLFLGFGESSLDFKLRFWTADYDNWIHTASEVTVAVNAALAAAGIVIPFPQRDLHVKPVEPI